MAYNEALATNVESVGKKKRITNVSGEKRFKARKGQKAGNIFRKKVGKK